MRAVYADTSALCKLAWDEAESEALFAFLAAEQTRLVASIIALVELPRAALRHIESSPKDGSAMQLAVTRTLQTVTLIDWNRPMLASAGWLGPATLRSLDAIHLACALDLGDRLDGMVTYDRRLAEAATDLGIDVRSPGCPS